jgi:hypothetical protein
MYRGSGSGEILRSLKFDTFSDSPNTAEADFTSVPDGLSFA